MLKKAFIILVLTFLTVSLSNCISLRAPKAPENFAQLSPPARAQRLSQIQAWKLNGAISVTQNQHTDIAQFTWQQQAMNYTINFSGPLNISHQQLTGNSQQVILINSQGQRFYAKTPEQLLEQELGWRLPVSGLRYWIRSLTQPHAAAATSYDAYGHLIQLQQQQWEIEYQRFQRVGNFDLPSIILLKSPQVFVKIVIKQWQL